MKNVDKLFELALHARSNAYSPYSQFKVGAALLSSGNRFYSGCNVENTSYPCGTCAEAGAIAAMIAAGDNTITEILITADSSRLITPCGACLQRIKEFATAQTLVHLADTSQVCKTVLLSELLPCAFDEKELRHE